MSNMTRKEVRCCMVGRQEKKKREGEGGSVSFNTALLIDGTKLKDRLKLSVIRWVAHKKNNLTNSGKVTILKYCVPFYFLSQSYFSFLLF